jgi:superfamily II DNA or RNA helicase
MPTGTGKSAVIALVPYYLRARTVLYIAPHGVIKAQLAETIKGANLPADQAAYDRLSKLICFFFVFFVFLAAYRYRFVWQVMNKKGQ